MLPSEIDVQAGLYQVIQIIPVIIITEPPPEETEIMKITEPHRSTSATQINISIIIFGNREIEYNRTSTKYFNINNHGTY
jgi:hypothetical protein